MFCQPGTAVVELFAAEYVNPVFWRLAKVVPRVCTTRTSSPMDRGEVEANRGESQQIWTSTSVSCSAPSPPAHGLSGDEIWPETGQAEQRRAREAGRRLPERVHPQSGVAEAPRRLQEPAGNDAHAEVDEVAARTVRDAGVGKADPMPDRTGGPHRIQCSLATPQFASAQARTTSRGRTRCCPPHRMMTGLDAAVGEAVAVAVATAVRATTSTRTLRTRRTVDMAVPPAGVTTILTV